MGLLLGLNILDILKCFARPLPKRNIPFTGFQFFTQSITSRLFIPTPKQQQCINRLEIGSAV